jgi:hypothetical protein
MGGARAVTAVIARKDYHSVPRHQGVIDDAVRALPEMSVQAGGWVSCVISSIISSRLAMRGSIARIGSPCANGRLSKVSIFTRDVAGAGNEDQIGG